MTSCSTYFFYCAICKVKTWIYFVQPCLKTLMNFVQSCLCAVICSEALQIYAYIFVLKFVCGFEFENNSNVGGGGNCLHNSDKHLCLYHLMCFLIRGTCYEPL